MFALGLGIQVSLKLLFNIKRILKSPMSLKQIFLRKDVFNLGLFLGGSSGIFRVTYFVLFYSGFFNIYFLVIFMYIKKDYWHRSCFTRYSRRITSWGRLYKISRHHSLVVRNVESNAGE